MCCDNSISEACAAYLCSFNCAVKHRAARRLIFIIVLVIRTPCMDEMVSMLSSGKWALAGLIALVQTAQRHALQHLPGRHHPNLPMDCGDLIQEAS